jgi:hypothetical protein
MQRRSLFRWFAAVTFLGCLVGTGCVSPTLPLPPPDAPLAISGNPTLDEWTVSGTCIQGALVTVFNEETGEGSVVEDRDLDGRYEVRIKGQRCDTGWVQQSQGQEVSSSTTFVLVETVNGLPQDPTACK